MKTAFLLVLFGSTIACSSPSGKKACTLDGRTFKIENYVDDKFESTEMLTFKDGKATNDECTKYGFGDGVYTADDRCGFKYTLTSPQEGRMDWEGQVSDQTITGKMVWSKAGQADIHYTFKGNAVR